MASEPYQSDRALELVAAEHWVPALKLAAKSKVLGKHRDAIQKAWSAIQRPDVYRELGQDPDALIAAGIAALKERYLGS
jgi:hypothetical protein